MRILVTHPGPQFSVADVHRGWVNGLRRAGAEVASFNLNDRLNFYAAAHVKNDDGSYRKAFNDDQVVTVGTDGLFSELFKGWPDVLLIISGFYVPSDAMPLVRHRGFKTAVLFTESPYQDDQQYGLASQVDLALVNDPTNLDRFREINPNSHYQPHCFDPMLHKPGKVRDHYQHDFTFVGTGYPSRIQLLEQIDWTGIDACIGGNWPDLALDSPLVPLLVHDLHHCLSNEETVRYYRGAKTSANLYRTEANRPELSAGWSMGPREVELAACGTFFLRDPRPESDELFPMLPAFTGPGDFQEQLHWWLAHDDERDAAALKARAAVEERTFENAAARFLDLIA